MSRRRGARALFLLGAVLLAAAAACDAPPARVPEAPPPSGPRAEAEPLGRIELVTGGARAEDALPLVVALHGLGDTPEGLARLYDGMPVRARVVLPRAPAPYGRGASWFPLPWDAGGQAAFTRGVASSSALVSALLEALPRERPTRGRPVLTGFSQGGILSFAVGTTRPALVSAVLPLAGWLPPALWPRARPAGAAAVPLRAYHGGDDDLLPSAPTEALVAHLARLGFDAEIRVFPGVGHAVTPAMLREYHALLAEALKRAAESD
jgi:phospholipase/carboxylesterase